jgi:hypothetical protein
MKWKDDSNSRKDKELYQKQKLKEKFPDNIQPERSKREDDKPFNRFICANCHGYKLFSNGCRCGALNSMETERGLSRERSRQVFGNSE